MNKKNKKRQLNARFYYKTNGDVKRVIVYEEDIIEGGSVRDLYSVTPKHILAMRDELKRLRVIARTAEAALAAVPSKEEHYRRKQTLLQLLEGWRQ